MIIHNPILTGSFTYNGADMSSLLSSSANITSLNAATASLNTFSASVLTFTGSVNTFTGSANSRLSSLEAATASLYSATSSFSGRVGALESYTASQDIRNTTYATTGSNTLVGTQYISNTNDAIGFSNTTSSIYTDGGLQVTKNAYFSSSMFIKGNLTVFGTQSVSFITSSQLNISTNVITVNTNTPSVRFGGLSVYDSGSTGTTGSIFWDSQNNHWVYTNPSGSSYSGGMFISGPRASSLGEEQGTTLNAIMKGQGGDHITSSGMFESGSNVGIGTSSPSYKLHVQGTSYFFDQSIFSDKVGIGTSSPTTTLHISGTTGGLFEVDGAAAINALFVSASGRVGIGTTSPEGVLTIQGTSAQPPTSGTTANSLLQLVGSLGNQLNIGSNTVAGDYGSYIQSSDNNLAVPYPLNLQPNGGSIGIGTSTPTTKVHIYEPLTNTTAYLTVQNNRARNAAVYTVTTNGGFYAGTSIGTDTFNYQIYDGVAGVSRITVDSVGNIGMGTSNPVATLPTGSSILINNGWKANSSVIASRKVLEINSNDNNGGNVGIFLRHLDKVTGLDIWSDNYYGNAYIDSRFDNTAASIGFRLRTANQANIIQPLTITSTGNVGIGTSSPGGILQVSSENSGNTQMLLVRNYATSATGNFSGNYTAEIRGTSNGNVRHAMLINNQENDSTRRVLDITSLAGTIASFVSNGSVGIGTTSPAELLHVYSAGTTGGNIRITDAGIANADWSILPSTGNTTAVYRIYNRPQARDVFNASPAGTITFNAYGTGTLSTNGSGVISASDGRLKTKTRSIVNSLDTIMQLQPTYYRWNEDTEFHTEYEELGFIAQEVAAVIPEASPEPEQEGKWKNYSDRAIIAVLTKAIQELKAEVDALKAQ